MQTKSGKVSIKVALNAKKKCCFGIRCQMQNPSKNKGVKSIQNWGRSKVLKISILKMRIMLKCLRLLLVLPEFSSFFKYFFSVCSLSFVSALLLSVCHILSQLSFLLSFNSVFFSLFQAPFDFISVVSVLSQLFHRCVSAL